MLDRPYIIHHRRPYRCLFLILAAVGLTLLGSWLMGQQWLTEQTNKLTSLQSQHAQLLDENQRLTEKNQALTSEAENINQLQAMQQATDSQLESELKSLQDRVIELNKELLFYQNITQGNVSSELQVRELLLRPVPDNPSSYTYRIVLTQGKRITQAIRGDILITLNLKGNGDGHSRLLDQYDLRIRHVQVLEGTLKIAENEQPESLRIMLRQEDKTLTERTFKWEVAPSPSP